MNEPTMPSFVRVSEELARTLTEPHLRVADCESDGHVETDLDRSGRIKTNAPRVPVECAANESLQQAKRLDK